MFFWGDTTYFLLIPALILSVYAQGKVSSTFNKFLKVESKKGYTGAQVARRILDENGLYNVPIQLIHGQLSDHYDPRKRILRLSDSVYSSSSVASLGVAAHEVGHAIQHATGYIPLKLRNSIVPLASFGSQVAWFLFFIGLLFSAPSLMDLGILFFSAAVLFQVITLPVELNASKRAIALLQSNGLIASDEVKPTKKVLQAAALTYVAATATAVLQLLRLFILRGSRDD
ncbi:zinc metallopeptidase [Garciella nitratireducens]|uniref:Zinc metallopeptidase n=1 Tax=Garciella nitratireducens DSM 15102 TaxID=1121911 RepID=A0A1T4JYY4_9FIRM|nr:zinc metallopeptidase [Garciella nitratireducens]RBP41106.1 hypothetical protein DFR81_1112 [Garciella nitratireducens]SJZ35462.1 hypothetical protein SAMN02745973_00228 [Garciella nitratireducens DSM 15102]